VLVPLVLVPLVLVPLVLVPLVLVPPVPVLVLPELEPVPPVLEPAVPPLAAPVPAPELPFVAPLFDAPGELSFEPLEQPPAAATAIIAALASAGQAMETTEREACALGLAKSIRKVYYLGARGSRVDGRWWILSTQPSRASRMGQERRLRSWPRASASSPRRCFFPLAIARAGRIHLQGNLPASGPNGCLLLRR